MTQPLPTTNPIAACIDDDDDHTIVIPPRTPDDYVVVLRSGLRLWVSLPPPVRALLPDGLFIAPTEPTPPLRKPHRPSIGKTIEQAEKAGKLLASITMPDGTRLDFTKTEQQGNEVDQWIANHAHAPERH
jgi:hypothetical protein